MSSTTPGWPLRDETRGALGGATDPIVATRAARGPDQLLRDARAIRRLLEGLEPDEHAARMRLVAAQDVVRLEAAQQWRERGWRPITEAVVVARRERTLLLAPILATAVAGAVSIRWLGDSVVFVAVLTLLAALPSLIELRSANQSSIRRAAALAAAGLGWHIATGMLPATLVFLPATLLLLAVAATGTVTEAPRLTLPDA